MNIYDERKKQVEEYLSFLEFVEESITKEGVWRERINTKQRKILLANTYIILYNLLECTFIQCFKDVSDEIQNLEFSYMTKLVPGLKSEWLEIINDNIKCKKEKTWDIFIENVEKKELAPFKFRQLNSRNWDNQNFEKKCNQYGIIINLTDELSKKIKRLRLNNMGAIALIKSRRNSLAHGEISFLELGQEETLSHLKNITEIEFEYLESVIQCFRNYIEKKLYLTHNRKESQMPKPRKKLDLTTFEGQFAERMLELREKAGLTQEEAAERLGVQPGAIYKWENGTIQPPLTRFPFIAKIYRVNISEILENF